MSAKTDKTDKTNKTSKPDKTYKVGDLFYTSWKQLSARQHAEVFALSKAVEGISKEDQQYGFTLIALMRKLRKNWRLTDRIDEMQMLDCYHDLDFLKQPWGYFREKELHNFFAPDDDMERHTFDHFIYADNEFTLFIVTQDVKYLARLAATLYRYNNEVVFEREKIEARGEYLLRKLKPWQLNLIYFTYAHIRESIVKRCRHLLPTEEETEGAKPRSTGAMWMQLKHRLSETTAFAGFDVAGKANVYDALDYMDGLAKLKAQQNA